MEGKMLGTLLPVLSIALDPGESVVAEAGEFCWMTDSIEMSTGTDSRQQGVLRAATRKADGSSLALSSYMARGSAGTVAFASKLPGAIMPIDVGAGGEYVVHRHGLMAGTSGIDISTGFRQSFTAGIFAADGFSLLRIGGQGRAWVGLAGDVIRFDLEAGRSLRTHPAHIGLFEASVVFQLTRAPGIVNRYFSGEAFHFAVLSGPGAVWLQSMPPPIVAASLGPYLADQCGHTAAIDSGSSDPLTNSRTEAMT
jgi:uncharacterized protein (AIM24 family)